MANSRCVIHFIKWIHYLVDDDNRGNEKKENMHAGLFWGEIQISTFIQAPRTLQQGGPWCNEVSPGLAHSSLLLQIIN